MVKNSNIDENEKKQIKEEEKHKENNEDNLKDKEDKNNDVKYDEINDNDLKKENALNSLYMEYNQRKNELENKKDEIIKKIEDDGDINNKENKKLYNYLSSIDYRLYENEEFKKNKEKEKRRDYRIIIKPRIS